MPAEETETETAKLPKRRKRSWHKRLTREPPPASPPGTLILDSSAPPRMFVIDYSPDVVVEREIQSLDEAVEYLTDDRPSITWVDIRGIGHRETFERIGRIFKIHALALEDIVNVPQRPKADVYADHYLIIGRMAQTNGDGALCTEQIAILFGKDFVLTVQEEPDRDVMETVRERIRHGRGTIRTRGADYLAYALLDSVVDNFFPLLERIGDRIEDLELEAPKAKRAVSTKIHDLKRELLTLRRAIWPQRDLVNNLLRDDSALITKETRIFLRDTYDHAIQVMDMVETFRELTSGLMDLYLSGVSNRMNEIMKVLTIISTIFLPITAIAGIYGMNFHHESSPFNMPELDWYYGYPYSLALMMGSVVGLLIYYWRMGWLGKRSRDEE
ncbi:magnesium/cobalt transporter CorA [Chondromyces apiculatus]|uniref:Magnesium transport protein CorA n=1 Tax=Chondromyces apiculatus DSM 436 TaxID=1192034 RepID=A0A017T4R1_9BACT|nr:magnesium/cobalt transporter CorA [Chondromyces apiculatus]EYF04253.1 Magnesium and cobalt transport protein CorA [Chondromyces apiculatus DSM 436]